MTNYYQLEYGSGKIFQYSKEEKEGYEKFTSSKGNVSYRKYLEKGLIGIFKGLTIKEGKFGQEVQVKVVNKAGDLEILTLPLLTQSNSLTQYVDSLASYVPGLKVDYIYRFYPYAIEQEDSERVNRGVSVKHITEDFESVNGKFPVERYSYTKMKDGEVEEEGDIPPVKWVPKAVGEGNERDSKERDTFLYKALKTLETDYKHASGGSSMPVKEDAGAPKPVASTPVAEEKPAEAPAKKEEPKKAEKVVVVDQQKEAAAIQANTNFDDVPESELPF